MKKNSMDHIDIAVNNVLLASGSALRNYSLSNVRNGMRKAMIDALSERQEVIDALERKIAHLEDENGTLLKDLDAATSRGT